VSSADRVEEARHRVREATDPFLVGDGPALADPRVEALFVLSGDIARLPRATPRPSPVAEDMQTTDDALTACVGKLLLGHTALAVDEAAAAAADVRADVNARGGSVEPSAGKGGGATVVVSLPSAC
jgi:hypothetical protein